MFMDRNGNYDTWLHCHILASVFNNRGARSKAAFITYVEGGYEAVGGEQAPEQPAYVDMMVKSVLDPFKKAIKDVQNVSWVQHIVERASPVIWLDAAHWYCRYFWQQHRHILIICTLSALFSSFWCVCMSACLCVCL